MLCAHRVAKSRRGASARSKSPAGRPESGTKYTRLLRFPAAHESPAQPHRPPRTPARAQARLAATFSRLSPPSSTALPPTAHPRGRGAPRRRVRQDGERVGAPSGRRTADGPPVEPRGAERAQRTPSPLRRRVVSHDGRPLLPSARRAWPAARRGGAVRHARMVLRACALFGAVFVRRIVSSVHWCCPARVSRAGSTDLRQRR